MNLVDPGGDCSARREIDDRVKIGSPQSAFVGVALPGAVMALPVQ